MRRLSLPSSVAAAECHRSSERVRQMRHAKPNPDDLVADTAVTRQPGTKRGKETSWITYSNESATKTAVRHRVFLATHRELLRKASTNVLGAHTQTK